MPGRTPKVCRRIGCETLAVKGAWLCQEHLGDRVRCEFRINETAEDGHKYTRQCKSNALKGTTFCQKHSGKKAREISFKTEALTRMQEFAKPYEGDMDPISIFEMEFRRTVGRIVWLEAELSLLDKQDLIWGKTKEEEINAGSGEYFTRGTNVTYEAKIHGFEDMLRWERKHLIDLEKVWIGAKLDQQKLNLMRDQITYTFTKAIEVARMLGHDPDAESTRQVLMAVFGSDSSDQAGAAQEGGSGDQLPALSR